MQTFSLFFINCHLDIILRVTGRGREGEEVRLLLKNVGAHIRSSCWSYNHTHNQVKLENEAQLGTHVPGTSITMEEKKDLEIQRVSSLPQTYLHRDLFAFQNLFSLTYIFRETKYYSF